MRRNAIIAACAGPGWAALLLVHAPGASAAPHPRAARVLSEAQVFAPDLAALRSLQDLPVTLDHGVTYTSDGRVSARLIGAPEVLQGLEALGFDVELRGPHRRGAPPPGYRDPEAGGAVLKRLAAASDRAGLVLLGHSVEDRPIEGLWIGAPPGSDAPVYRVLGAHHGDEWSSFEVALAVAEALVARDGVDPAITGWLDHATVWIVPYVNPDGVVAGSRYNARGVDLNRNYDLAWSPLEFAGGMAAFSEPEARAVRDTFHYAPPVLGLSLHSGAVNIGYVWNHTTDLPPEVDLLEALAWTYADTTTASGFWVTNGAAWYVTRGDTNDWSYGRYGTFDYTVELTQDKRPPADAIARYVDDHLDANLAMLLTPPDLSARVIDAETGEPLAARGRLLTATGLPETAWSVTAPDTGWLHRIAADGPARLELDAPGYRARVVDVHLPMQAPLEVALVPDTLQPGRATPAVAQPGEPIELPTPDGPVRLERPGAAPVVLLAQGGRVRLPDDLAPGPWSVVTPDDEVIPNAVLVASDPPPAVHLQADGLRLSGIFGPGSRAWGLWGERRSLRPLPVLDEGPEHILLDLTDLPADVVADVLVLTGGRHLAVSDVRGLTPVDGIGPPRLVGGGGCACTTVLAHRSLRLVSILSWLPALAFLLFRRRRP